MSNQNKPNNKGDTLAWIAKSLPSHAERQVATYKEIMELGAFSEGNDKMIEMRDAVKAVAQDKVGEWKESVESTLRGEILAIEKLAEHITTPGRAAKAIGRVDGNDVRVVKWRIVGDPTAMYCVKHSSPKSPTTRGHAYLDCETGQMLGTHCQKCISELSNKKGQHQLRRLLERSGKLEKSDDRRGKSGKPRPQSTSDLAKELIKSSGPVESASSLSSSSMADLRELARSRGAEKLPRSKSELIQLVLDLKPEA